MTRNIFLSLLFLLCQELMSQDIELRMPKNTGKLYKEALSALEMSDFFLAHKYFEELEKRGFQNSDQRFQYAVLLQKINDYTKALENFQLLRNENYNHPLISYYLCLQYQHQQDYKSARDHALFFLKNKEYKKEFPNEYTHISVLRNSLDTLILKKDKNQASIYIIEENINESGAEFNPIYHQGKLIFGSQDMRSVKFFSAHERVKTDQSPTRKIWEAKGQRNKYTSSQFFPILTDTVEVSSFSFGADKRVFYYTGCKYREHLRRMKCDLYVSKYKDDKWTDPSLVKELFDPENTMTHIQMGFDANKNAHVLYFSSDRPGTRGGYDLYAAVYNSRTLLFSTPRNLGNKINTPKDDITPYYHNPTNTLYFSSNGRGGQGGHDVFYTQQIEGNFREVATMSPEINTPQDDVFFAPNTDPFSGYLVSNRYSKNSLLHPHCCDDIYYYEMTSDKRIGKEGKIKIIGRDRKSKQIIKNIEYELFHIDTHDIRLVEENTVYDSVTIRNLKEKSKYELRMRAPGYYKKKEYITIKDDSLYIVEFELDSIDYKPILLPLVEFDFDSFTLTPVARHIIDSMVIPVLDQNPKLTIELSAHTDSRGTDIYNEQLSEKRAAAIRFYLVNHHMIIPERLESKGYGEYAPVAPNEYPDGTDNPDGRQRNRRCEFRILPKEYDPY